MSVLPGEIQLIDVFSSMRRIPISSAPSMVHINGTTPRNPDIPVIQKSLKKIGYGSSSCFMDYNNEVKFYGKLDSPRQPAKSSERLGLNISIQSAIQDSIFTEKQLADIQTLIEDALSVSVIDMEKYPRCVINISICILECISSFSGLLAALLNGCVDLCEEAQLCVLPGDKLLAINDGNNGVVAFKNGMIGLLHGIPRLDYCKAIHMSVLLETS
jgi:hypothetical protein